MSNLFWGMQFRTCRIFWDFADHQSSLNPKKSYKYKSHAAITSIVVALATNLKIKCESIQKFLLLFAFAKSRIPLYLVIARFGYAESWQSKIKISRTKCNRISPDSWCKKSDSNEQKCECRFFARIGKGEALPLKAKSGSFWRVGGAGWGVQPFCEKKQAILKNKVTILSPNLTQIPKLIKSTFKA